MKLYHGTKKEYLQSILENGLCPRSITGYVGSDSVWSAASNTVYLTDTYATVYASWKCRPDELAVIFEIDGDALDESMMRPDEDYLVHYTYDRAIAKYLVEGDYCNSLWKKSLVNQGQVGYAGVVPVSAITRYAIVKSTFLMEAYTSFEVSEEYHRDYKDIYQGGIENAFSRGDVHLMHSNGWAGQHKKLAKNFQKVFASCR